MVEETSDYGDLRQRDDDSNDGGTGPSSATTDDDENNNNNNNNNNNGQSYSFDGDPSSSSVARTNVEFDSQQRVTRQSKRRRRRPSLPPPSSCRRSRSRSRVRAADDRTAGNETDDGGGENAAAATTAETDKDDDKCGGGGGAVDTDKEQRPDEDPILKSAKSLFYNTLENDFQCPVCNEMIVKACTANCGHAFCRNCIRRWIKINKICPVCRTPVRAITNCIPVDTFITNICEIIGGTVKEERDKLLKERIPEPAVRRKRKRLRNPEVHNH